ncbi:hypothetical protein [Olivibacter sp. XZL3]|uniref:hypothetical protein n=1 Tax=Olivibacter sp. XZL3 TaxID=1735116 RepID=UPI001F112F9E|nr:hypothetical protein [Olivibacter sp. XZL3]
MRKTRSFSITASKIGFNREPELLYKYFLENTDVVLLVKDQHRLFVFNGIYRPKGDRTVLIGDQNGIADDPCSPFVAIIECLDVGQQHSANRDFSNISSLSLIKLHISSSASLIWCSLSNGL